MLSESVCADCGKPFDHEKPAGYVQASLRYHIGCGDPFGQKARDAQLTLVRAQRDALLEVVKPFADAADMIQRRRPDVRMDHTVAIGVSGLHDWNVKFGDLRKAREVRDAIEAQKGATISELEIVRSSPIGAPLPMTSDAEIVDTVARLEAMARGEKTGTGSGELTFLGDTAVTLTRLSARVDELERGLWAAQGRLHNAATALETMSQQMASAYLEASRITDPPISRTMTGDEQAVMRRALKRSVTFVPDKKE